MLIRRIAGRRMSLRAPEGMRGIKELSILLMLQETSRSERSVVRPSCHDSNILTRMTGRSPWTRFSSTSPRICPALFALSTACIQVLSSDMDAMLYTVLQISLRSIVVLKSEIHSHREFNRREVCVKDRTLYDLPLELSLNLRKS